MTVDKELFGMLLTFLASAKNMTEAEVMAEVRRRGDLARNRMAAKNDRYRVAVSRITDKQAMRITQQEAKGFVFNSLYQNKASGNVAVMLHKAAVYNPMTQKIGGKTMFVYPDGHSNEAYGNKCPLEPQF